MPMFEQIPRFPHRLTRERFLPTAYEAMYLSRRLDERMAELFRRGLVKGTVTQGIGNEATSVGMSLPLRPGKDVVCLMHRDVIGHVFLGMEPYALICQYMANAESPTHAREGNVHHGDASQRRLPMMSHLGAMLSTVVGAVWAARRSDDDVLGLAIIGDGGTSTGAFHESLNIASVREVPVLFLVENNQYAFSTPLCEQYRCETLSRRAESYGIEGVTVDGTDVCAVYETVCEVMERMLQRRQPAIVESLTLRMTGHAVYDKADYVSARERDEWMKTEPLGRARASLLELGSFDEAAIGAIEKRVDECIEEATARALTVGRPKTSVWPLPVHAPSKPPHLKPLAVEKATNQTAVTAALDYILSNDPDSLLLGLDIAQYGSAFKTCKGLFERYGRNRVTNMPLSEAGIMGFALGATQTGARPIVEFQFADFVTEAVTQLGLNCGTWYFRSGQPVPLLVRLPCGGGVTLGAFHSGEFEGLISRFAGLKALYPTTPQEMFEAIVAGYHDPNPCVVFEHKLLYTAAKGAIAFDGDVSNVWRARQYRSGSDMTVVATGAMASVALRAVERKGYDADVWNPFVLAPLAESIAEITDSVRRTGRLLVVQESTETAGMADRIVSTIVRSAWDALKTEPRIVAAPDEPVPFAPELETLHIPGVERISEALTELLGV
ncbi:MAG: transketolase, partial [Chitinivibrionales bacterium]|nr:transketolase [Chitinivibrionales bacterium]